MKKLLTTLLLSAIVVAATAQAPNKLNYQAIVKNGTGTALINKNIAIEVSILDTINGFSLFSEVHNVTTSDNGIVSLEIGSINSLNLSWDGDRYLNIAIDTLAGSNFIDYSVSQILSVPYAINSNESNHSATTDTATYAINSGPTTSFNLDPSAPAPAITETIDAVNFLYSMTLDYSATSIPEELISSDVFIKFYRNGVYQYGMTNVLNFGNTVIFGSSPYAPGETLTFKIHIVTENGYKIFTHIRTL